LICSVPRLPLFHKGSRDRGTRKRLGGTKCLSGAICHGARDGLVTGSYASRPMAVREPVRSTSGAYDERAGTWEPLTRDERRDLARRIKDAMPKPRPER